MLIIISSGVMLLFILSRLVCFFQLTKFTISATLVTDTQLSSIALQMRRLDSWITFRSSKRLRSTKKRDWRKMTTGLTLMNPKRTESVVGAGVTLTLPKSKTRRAAVRLNGWKWREDT